MKKSHLAIMLIAVLGIGLIGYVSTYIFDEKEIPPSISRYPQVANYKEMFGKIETLPEYDENSTDNWQVDVRSTDLTSIDLSDRLTDLLHADFDSETQWPNKLPESFDPLKIMALSKDPGLDIRTLHEEGITGKGVSIAIIDQTLLIDHQEYADNIKFYEEINIQKNEAASMHGAAVSSIAVGETVGVAPEADLYYIAETHGTYSNKGFDWDFTYLAQSIDRILEINKELPKDKKIRVISISVGWGQDQKGYKEVTESVERAKNEGIFVVSSSLQETYGLQFLGLGRDSLSDSNQLESYKPGEFWAMRYYSGDNDLGQNTLLVPMDSRCTASPTGQDDYVFYSSGGVSWSIPYIAGLYALCCQIEPSITPELFWEKALTTGSTIDIEKNGKTYKLGKIVNPTELIKSFD